MMCKLLTYEFGCFVHGLSAQTILSFVCVCYTSESVPLTV